MVCGIKIRCYRPVTMEGRRKATHRSQRQRSLITAAVAAGALAAAMACTWRGAAAVTPFVHDWDTVSSVMSAHGKWDSKNSPGTTGGFPSASSIHFAATNYATVTMGTGCSDLVNGSAGFTIEDQVWAAARAMKAVNPDVKLGMYWRTPFALELAGCSQLMAEWAAHPEWRLKDDNGTVVMRGSSYFLDYEQVAVQQFFTKLLLNTASAKLPSGKPVLDYVYLDGAPSMPSPTGCASEHLSGERCVALTKGKAAMCANTQNQLDAAGLGQKVILNGMDTPETSAAQVATGAAGSMFDHFSILQFLDSGSDVGAFNMTAMDAAFQLATSPERTNVTTQIKGWPGPIVHQRDQYPPGLPQPKTASDFQNDAASRFNSELALFLLVANQFDFWIYTWFWGWDDNVPGAADSTLPVDFFPQAKCALGSPQGNYQRIGSTFTYKRAFEHASVFVDLANRTNSRVEFDSC